MQPPMRIHSAPAKAVHEKVHSFAITGGAKSCLSTERCRCQPSCSEEKSCPMVVSQWGLNGKNKGVGPAQSTPWWSASGASPSTKRNVLLTHKSASAGQSRLAASFHLEPSGKPKQAGTPPAPQEAGESPNRNFALKAKQLSSWPVRVEGSIPRIRPSLPKLTDVGEEM